MRRYNMDLKIRVIDFCLNSGSSYREASRIFKVGKSSIWRWINEKDNSYNLNNQR